MIKVLFMIHDLGVGGAEKVLVNLLNHMDKTKFEVTLISLFGGGVNEQFLNKDIHYKSIFKKTFPGNSRIMKLFTPKLLHRMFVKEEYDIEVSYLEGPSARIISGTSNTKAKLVSWIHVEQHTGKVAAKAFRSYRESVECYKRFHKTVCVSNYVREDYQSIYPEIENIIVLYNTNETAHILNQKDKSIERKDLFKKDEINLCGVGKIVPVKGFDKLARIHKRLKDDGYPVHTYVLGIGPEQKKIEMFLKEHKLEDSFTFLGYQTNPYKYVSKSDLFVCASVAEGFSTATTEALIVGTPVCTVDVSGMKEMLGANNEYGLVTSNNEEALYEGIKRLLQHPELLESYKEKAKERGKVFSTENTVKAVENMLIELKGK